MDGNAASYLRTETEAYDFRPDFQDAYLFDKYERLEFAAGALQSAAAKNTGKRNVVAGEFSARHRRVVLIRR
jgi:hypothetical protein